MRHYIIAYPTKGMWVYGGTLEKGEAVNHPGCMVSIFRDYEWGVMAIDRCYNEINRRNLMRAYMEKKNEQRNS